MGEGFGQYATPTRATFGDVFMTLSLIRHSRLRVSFFRESVEV